MVKRYRVSNGLVTGGQTLFDLVNLDVVLASDYDALASDLVAEKAIGTTAMYSAIERDVTIESMQADLDEAKARIRELEAALAIVTQDRDTLLAMTGTTIEQVAARIRSAQETPVAHSKSQQKRIEAMTAPETKGE